MAQYEHSLSTPVGFLYLRTSDEFVEEIRFTEEAPDSKAEYPAGGLMSELIKQLQEYFDGKRQAFSLPLSPKGTAFQQKVWEQLKAIPFGKSLSYLELARQLGDEKAVRAVGLANGKNPVAIIIPCHRIIGSDGSLTGYAGGLKRKQWLLRHEGILKQLPLFQ